MGIITGAVFSGIKNDATGIQNRLVNVRNMLLNQMHLSQLIV